MTKQLVWLTPSRGRPIQLENLILSWINTTDGLTDLVVYYDKDDPSYTHLIKRYPQVIWDINTKQVNGKFLHLLTDIAEKYKDSYKYLAFMEDDCTFETPGFEDKLISNMDEEPYVLAYTNDELNTPTIVSLPIMSSNIFKGLGWYAPPIIHCLWGDYFWKALGSDLGCLMYFPNIVIKHRHHTVEGKPADLIAQTIDKIGRDNDYPRYKAYESSTDYNADIERVKRYLSNE